MTIKFKVPATSANLGIGFDCMGIAFNLYNFFEIKEANNWIFEGFIEEEIKKNNLFLKAYLKAAKYKKIKAKPLLVKLKSNIPMCGGLGSSSSLIVAGIYAFNLINNNCLNKDEIFKIALSIEKHPDNIAPAIYGGLCIINNNEIMKIKISNKWHFGLWIFNYYINTEKARSIIKKEISIDDAVNNISSALFVLKALEDFDVVNINKIMNDKIHEPYRKKLIKKFNNYKKMALQNGALAFVISGSGSACLSISDKDLSIKENGFKYINVKIDKDGVRNV